METLVPQPLSQPPVLSDAPVLKMWLHGKSHNTAQAYRADAISFLRFTGRSLATTTLADLQAWHESMIAQGHSEGSRMRRLTAVRALLKFAVSMELLTSNPAANLKTKRPASQAAERIVTDTDMKRLIGAESSDRAKCALRLLYVCGLRASEVCGLTWRDMTARGKKGGEARVTGKGGKVRSVIVPADLWDALANLQQSARPDSPVVPDRSGGRMGRTHLHRLVKRAVKRVGLPDTVSAHWFRHSHASHSLDEGCPIHVLQKSLGHSSLATTSIYAHVKKGEGSASFLKG